MKRCLNCMKEYEADLCKCPHCNYEENTKPAEPYHLVPGLILNQKYTIGTVIGFGGFGVIYKAWDNNLKKIVAVKEYYPTAFLSRMPGETQAIVFNPQNTEDFNRGKAEFLAEARNLAKFNQHPNIVHVYDFFEANGTAYFVMEYLDGFNLNVYMQVLKKQKKTVDVETAKKITIAVLKALKVLHEKKIIHRDIKPSNIFLCRNGDVKLIDLGAASFSDLDKELTRAIVITPCYAPVEQYDMKSKQGPFTDIYAVGAVLYEMLTGIKPAEAVNRKIKDTMQEPAHINGSVPKKLSAACMRAMAVKSEIRFQNVDQFLNAITKQKKVRTDQEEIRFRNIRRIIVILLILALIGVAAYNIYLQYQKKYEEAVLPEAELSVWLPYEEDMSEEDTLELLQLMTEEYLQNNPAISVSYKAIPDEQYEEELIQALSTGEGPDVFDSSCLGDEYTVQFAQLDDLYSFPAYSGSDYVLLNDYKSYILEQKQLPLSFDIPILYENTISEKKQTSDLSVIADADKTEFLKEKSRYYLGNTRDYADVQETFAAVYQVGQIADYKDLEGEFVNLWSIRSDVSEDEYNAAVRLLYYYLSETAQDYYTIQNNHAIPVNKTILNTYKDIYDEFDISDDILKELSFVNEK